MLSYFDCYMVGFTLGLSWCFVIAYLSTVALFLDWSKNG